MKDPTIEEMRKHLASFAANYEVEAFDVEEAIYWFASNFYAGQGSNLYAALCASQFKPGIACGCDPTTVSGMLYDELVYNFADGK